MKHYRIIPSLMASVLAIVLTGCSSSGSSYSPDHAADRAHQERLERENAEREKAAERERLEREKAEQDRLAKEKNVWRDFKAVTSYNGGYKYKPELQQGPDTVLYSSGPLELSKDNTLVTLADESFVSNRELFKNGEINPQNVQSLVVTDEAGNALGKFQFVNQEYSSYTTFMAEKPANAYDPNYDKSEALAYYIAKPSTKEQLAVQHGTFDYNGKALGYRGGVKGSTPKEAASADIQFKVNFDNKTISGRIEAANRFDDLGATGFSYVKGFDSNGNKVYHEEYNDRTSRALILKETAIIAKDGVVGFGHRGVSDENAGITLNNGTHLGITDYGGIFSGPNLEEVVGQIGGGEDRIIFGATKEKK